MGMKANLWWTGELFAVSIILGGPSMILYMEGYQLIGELTAGVAVAAIVVSLFRTWRYNCELKCRRRAGEEI